MKTPSKYFDSIRVSGNKRAKTESPQPETFPPCEWKGCGKPAPHRAPKGRGREGEFFLFCTDHVRQYNASYNYFDGMSDDQVEDYRKDALTGHRPTWKVGANAWAHGTKNGSTSTEPLRDTTGTASRQRDPHAFFAYRAKQAREEAAESRRKLRPLEKKSLDVLHLGETATKEQIKQKYKELVKQHHPDANGGDPRSAEKLREIIQAYNFLKQAGMA